MTRAEVIAKAEQFCADCDDSKGVDPQGLVVALLVAILKAQP